MRFAVIAIVCCVASPSRSWADVVVDQQHSFSSSIADSTNGNVSEVGQTFTVGVAGSLHQIDVFMFRLGGIFDPTGDPILSIYSTAGGVPTGSPLASFSVAESQVPLNTAGFVSFNVSSAAIPVSVGDVLAFGISTTSEVGPYFLPNDDDFGTVNDYTTGAAYRRIINPVGAWQQFPVNADHGFRTYVSAAVPEASSWLFGSAAVGLTMVARRVRRSKRSIDCRSL